jgi:hypothetical protein
VANIVLRMVCVPILVSAVRVIEGCLGR